MTAKELYEGVLIELNKENAPNILLEQFNYFANKSIYQYINKRYNIYDVNQQTTDDLRVLKSMAVLTPIKVNNIYNGLTTTRDAATYYVDLPADYLHLLNCIVIYNVKKTYKCYNKNDTWRAAATRLTADAYSQVLDNFWLKPTYKRPYYYIHNININETLPTNPYNPTTGNGTDSEIAQIVSDTDKTNYSAGERTIVYSDRTEVISYRIGDGGIRAEEISRTITPSTNSNEIQSYGTDGNGNLIVQGTGLPKTINIGGQEYSNVERGQGLRYGNVSKVRLEIRYGTDTSVFTLDPITVDGQERPGQVYIDYIKTPQHIRLTQQELDLTEDTSQILEFPDYVCQEILNELVHIIMENISDPKLQTHPVVSQSIANPAQAQAPQAAQGQAAQ